MRGSNPRRLHDRQAPGFSGEDALALNQRRDGSSPSPGSDTFHIRVAKWQRGRLLTVSSQVRSLPLVPIHRFFWGRSSLGKSNGVTATLSRTETAGTEGRRLSVAGSNPAASTIRLRRPTGRALAF